MTKVIHIKDAPKGWNSNPNYVYIGRAGKGQTGYYGNPHKVGRCPLCNVDHSNGEAATAFGSYFKQKVLEDDEFRKAVLQLREKYLVCFCKTRERPDTPCHGDVYVAFLNGLQVQ